MWKLITDNYYSIAWIVWSLAWCLLLFGLHNKPAPRGFRKKLPREE